MIFFWSGKALNYFQTQAKIFINLKKQQNHRKITEIMKKKGFLASFLLGGTLNSVFNFQNS